MRGAVLLQPRSVPRRGARHPRLLMVCALLSALGHAAVLLNGSDGSSGHGDGSMATQAREPVPERTAVSTVRLLNAPALSTPAPEPVASAVAITTEPAAPGPMREPEPIARLAGDDHDDGDDRYLARSQLDQPPAAQADIALPFPDTAPLGSYRAVLTLFIDTTGQVQRVRTESAAGTEGTEGARLPPSLDNAARQAFLAARFTPGVKDGQPVRSRIRVEVLYSTELLAQRSASAGVAGGESAP